VGLTLTSCPTQPTTPPEPATLTEEYTTSTEVWLRVSVLDSTDHAGLRVYRDDSLLVNFPVAPVDTVVIDGGLQPNTTHAYHTVRLQDNDERSPSEPLNVTTLPTTSHNFTWTIDTLGNYGSYLNDVVIVDEDNIWAVGNIVTDSMEYNAARWDGERWHLMGIYSNTLDLYSIQYFASDDIWVTDICSPIHWDGDKWTLYHLQNMGLDACAGNAIWGTSSSNLYFVGDDGTIVHYDGQSFTRETSGTSIDLTDVMGSPSSGRLWAGGVQREDNQSVILTSTGNVWTTIYARDASGHTSLGDSGWTTPTIQSLWIAPSDGPLWVIGGMGVFQFLPANHPQGYHRVWVGTQGYPAAYTWRIRGNAPNNIFIAGEHGELFHFNGKTWHEYSGQFPTTIHWYSVKSTNRDLVLVGEDIQLFQALVAVGYR